MDEACKQLLDLWFSLRNGKDILIDSTNQVENMKLEEIAKLLNIETDNARQRFRRSLEKFNNVVQRSSCSNFSIFVSNKPKLM